MPEETQFAQAWNCEESSYVVKYFIDAYVRIKSCLTSRINKKRQFLPQFQYLAVFGSCLPCAPYFKTEYT